MKLRTMDILAIALAAVSLLYQPAANPTPDKIPAPAATEQAAVAPVTKILVGHKTEAAELAAFYHAAAEVVGRDKTVIATTQQLRAFCERAVTLRFQGVFTQIPGLAEAIHGPSGAMAAMLGLEAKEIDRVKASAALDAVAWACQEAAR